MPFDSNRVFCQLCWSRPKSILWANPCSEHNCYLRSKVRNGVNCRNISQHSNDFPSRIPSQAEKPLPRTVVGNRWQDCHVSHV
jgi:hypothetical protein